MGIRNKVEDKVIEIADVLQGWQSNDFSLFNGLPGKVMFLLNLYRYTNEEKYYNQAQDILGQLIDQTMTHGGYYSYCGGLAGFCWFLEHLSENGHAEIEDLDEMLQPIDDYLLDFLKTDLDKKNLDLLHGATGTAYYFLKRGHKEALDIYLQALEAQAVHEEDDAIKWPFYVGELDKDHFNFGLAHGIPSQIAFLSLCLPHLSEKQTALNLISGAVKYLSKQERNPGPFESMFPNNTIPSKPDGANSRLAWCYGDLGISCSFWQAGKAMNNNELVDFSKQIMEYNATRKMHEDTLLVDAGLCHGTAGVAQMYQRFFELTGSAQIKNAADYWYQTTIEQMANHQKGLAGFQAFHGESGWVNEHGFLTGISGIGLFLLSYLEPSLSDWDRILLLPQKEES